MKSPADALADFLSALDQLNKTPHVQLASLNCLPEMLRAEQTLRAIRKDIQERE